MGKVRSIDRVLSWFAVVASLCVIWAFAASRAIAQVAEGEVDVGTVNEALQQWEFIVAFVLPLIIAAMVRNGFSERLQAMTMLAVSAVVVVVTMYLNGELNDFESFLYSFFKVVALTIAYYKGVWKPLGVAPAVQNRINP